MPALWIRPPTDKVKRGRLLPGKPSASSVLVFSRRSGQAGIPRCLHVLLEIVKQPSQETALVPQLDNLVRLLVPLLGLHFLARDNLVGREPSVLLEAVVDPVPQSGFPVNEVVRCARVVVASLTDVKFFGLGRYVVAFGICRVRKIVTV